MLSEKIEMIEECENWMMIRIDDGTFFINTKENLLTYHPVFSLNNSEFFFVKYYCFILEKKIYGIKLTKEKLIDLIEVNQTISKTEKSQSGLNIYKFNVKQAHGKTNKENKINNKELKEMNKENSSSKNTLFKNKLNCFNDKEGKIKFFKYIRYFIKTKTPKGFSY